MKRKASAAFHEKEDDAAGEPAPRRLDDCFVAAEILPRLPAHAARAFATASAFFRGVLTDPDFFWLARRGLTSSARAPPPPHAACLIVRCAAAAGETLHEFHYADAASTAEPAVARAAGGSLFAGYYDYSGTCNGLVLLAAPWSWNNPRRATSVLLNPASGEETVVTVVVPGGRRRHVLHQFCGFGFSPSSRSYKALLCARDFDRGAVELMAVPFGGAAGRRQEPWKVAVLAWLFYS